MNIGEINQPDPISLSPLDISPLVKPAKLRRFRILVPVLGSLLLVSLTFLVLVVSQRRKQEFVAEKADFSDFYAALETQDLAYDYNLDGAVTGDDINLILQKRPTLLSTSQSTKSTEETVESIEAVTGGTDTAAIGSDPALPSIRGASSDAFTGSAAMSYGFSLPQGQAGLTPSLSLSYSSGSVDDAYVGTQTKWRNDAYHPYQVQAGFTGLGWSLGGIFSITRNNQGTLNGEADDTFIINSGAGSANLVYESGARWYESGVSYWRTAPNLKMKIERWQKCRSVYATGYDNPVENTRYVCRAQWFAYDANGTKYVFGSNPTTSWRRTEDPDKDLFGATEVYEWYPLYQEIVYDSSSNKHYLGYTPWMLNGGIGTYWGGLHSTTSQWLLTRTESIYNSTTHPAMINYSYSLELNTYPYTEDDIDKYKYYVRADYPYEITYFPHKISFVYEPRWDYKIHRGTDSNPKQVLTATKRLNKIIINTDGQDIRSYLMNYHYGYDATKHPDVNPTNGVLDQAEVKSGQVIHSLLEDITPYSGNKI